MSVHSWVGGPGRRHDRLGARPIKRPIAPIPIAKNLQQKDLQQNLQLDFLQQKTYSKNLQLDFLQLKFFCCSYISETFRSIQLKFQLQLYHLQLRLAFFVHLAFSVQPRNSNSILLNLLHRKIQNFSARICYILKSARPQKSSKTARSKKPSFFCNLTKLSSIHLKNLSV